jgi:hypothetical protein
MSAFRIGDQEGGVEPRDLFQERDHSLFQELNVARVEPVVEERLRQPARTGGSDQLREHHRVDAAVRGPVHIREDTVVPEDRLCVVPPAVKE